MTDEQLHRRMISKRLLIVAVVLILLGCGLLYYRFYRQPELANYRSLKAQEQGLRDQVTQLQATNGQMSAMIEENGKELVSFSEDKIVYINLASELSSKWDVTINELSVSDIWTEGQMAGMTTVVEVQGNLESVRGFISDYCGSNYTNRISRIACRPDDRFEWMYRYIDDLQILKWFDLAKEKEMWETENAEAIRQQQQEILNNGGSLENWEGTSGVVKSITLDDMFKNYTFKLYLQVDFLGRQ